MLETLIKRDRLVVLGGLILVIILAWAYILAGAGMNMDATMTTPHEHDREAATVQGLTHLIAKVLLSMAPLPSRMTTRSFDLLVDSISMVQNDAPEVFEAIEKANPYAEDVRRHFFNLAYELSVELENSA